jgi:hypothetical protein
VHVALAQIQIHASRVGTGAGLFEHRRRGVNADDRTAGGLRGWDGDTPVADRQLNRDEALVIRAITHAVLTRDVQVNLQPSLSDVATDKAVPFLDGCAPS